MTGESIIEEAIGEEPLAIPGIELGYCARPAEVGPAHHREEAAGAERAGSDYLEANWGSSIFFRRI